MSRYHFFKQAQSFTSLATRVAGDDDERHQRVEQGVMAVAAPSYADILAEVLTLLQDHEAREEKHRAHNPWYSVAGNFSLRGMH
jgi:UDP-N-acetylglucosamine 2-epimerase